MGRLSIVGMALLGLCVTAAAADEKGLVAHWDFDEAKGGVLHDKSGNENHGKIHGAKWVKCGKGYALRFDGIDDYVNCGHGPSLDIRGPISLEAWVCVEGMPKGEPGILGKQFSSYLLTYYANGNCYWYICEGGNHCKAGLSLGSWSHIVGTFDGTTMKLYFDGEMVGARQSKHPAIKSGRNLFIGCVLGDASADDPAYAKTSYFRGAIDDVRIYNRALSAEEVRSHYQHEVKTGTLEPAVEFSRVKESVRLKREDIVLRLGKTGAMQIDVGKDAYVLESFFSYPGDKIGTNALSDKPANSETGWRPEIKRRRRTIEIRAQGRYYSLERKVRIRNNRVEVEDTLTNLADVPVGIIIQNKVVAQAAFVKPHLVGSAENPTIFLSQRESGLGILEEDTIGRLQFEPFGFSNQAGFELNHFALDVGKSYTFTWAIYPFGKEADYFTLVNRIREDWKSNFTIGGPFQFLDARSSLVSDPARLRAYLERKKLKIVTLTPWFDYFTGQHLSRGEYKKIVQKAVRVFRKVDPEIKCIGAIETDWVSLRPEQIKGFELLPVHKPGGTSQVLLSPSQTKIIDDAALPWRDSFMRSADGTLQVELYTVRGRPFSAIQVYPEIGNYHYDFLMEQIRFLLDEVGLDGFYIDQFSLARPGCAAYGKWDGYTVDVDPRTGKIQRKYTNCGLAGATARKNLCEYALTKGKIVVANWWAAAEETQSLPVMRFAETWGNFDVAAIPKTGKPQLVPRMYGSHLASPIGLGLPRPKGRINSAELLVRGIILYLRHGVLYYHYHYGDIPETGEGSGEYGPINHMFPITPVRLFEGGIEGKERTITCVSGTYRWKGERPPRIFLFDGVGREKKHYLKPDKTDAGWEIVIDLRDWQEIAVIE